MIRSVLSIIILLSNVAIAQLSSRIKPIKTQKDGVVVVIEEVRFARQLPNRMTANKQKKFMILKVEIENKRNSDLWVSPYNFSFIDHQNEQTKSHTFYQGALPGIELMPGSKTSGYITIQVPFLYKGGALFYEYVFNKKMKLNLPRRFQD